MRLRNCIERQEKIQGCHRKMNWLCKLRLHRWKYTGRTFLGEDEMTQTGGTKFAFAYINKRECTRCGLIQDGSYGAFGPFHIVQSSGEKTNE